MAGSTPAFSRKYFPTAILLALGILASFGRESILASLFGTNAEVERFRLAFALPNLLATSLAPVFTAALIPTLTGMARPEHRGTGLRAATLPAFLLSVTVGVLGAATTDLQARIIAPGLDLTSRAALANLMVLFWVFYSIVAVTFGPRAFLSTTGTTWPMASSSLVLSGTMALILSSLYLFGYEPLTAHTIALAALGAAITLLLLHAAALPTGTIPEWLRLTFITNFRKELLLPTLAIVSAAAGHIIGNLPRLVDRALATELPPGTVAGLDYSFAIITVPGVLLGTAFNIAALPLLTANLKSPDPAKTMKLFNMTLLTILIAFGVGPIVSLSAPQLVQFAFERGNFSTFDTSTTATFLYWHGFALGPLIASLIFSQILISAGFLRLFLAISALRLLVKLFTARPLAEHFGLDGLAASFIAPEVASFFIGLLAVLFLFRKGSLFCKN